MREDVGNTGTNSKQQKNGVGAPLIQVVHGDRTCTSPHRRKGCFVESPSVPLREVLKIHTSTVLNNLKDNAPSSCWLTLGRVQFYY